MLCNRAPETIKVRGVGSPKESSPSSAGTIRGVYSSPFRSYTSFSALSYTPHAPKEKDYPSYEFYVPREGNEPLVLLTIHVDEGFIRFHTNGLLEPARNYATATKKRGITQILSWNPSGQENGNPFFDVGKNMAMVVHPEPAQEPEPAPVAIPGPRADESVPAARSAAASVQDQWPRDHEANLQSKAHSGRVVDGNHNHERGTGVAAKHPIAEQPVMPSASFSQDHVCPELAQNMQGYGFNNEIIVLVDQFIRASGGKTGSVTYNDGRSGILVFRDKLSGMSMITIDPEFHTLRFNIPVDQLSDISQVAILSRCNALNILLGRKSSPYPNDNSVRVFTVSTSVFKYESTVTNFERAGFRSELLDAFQ